jgi:hypothetical protein
MHHHDRFAYAICDILLYTRSNAQESVMTDKRKPVTSTVSEAELADAMRNSAVIQLTIEQSQRNKYRIVAKLTWKEGDFQLVTTRKAVREWASMDRLIRHIQSINGTPPKINLVLNTTGN